MISTALGIIPAMGGLDDRKRSGTNENAAMNDWVTSCPNAGCQSQVSIASTRLRIVGF